MFNEKEGRDGEDCLSRSPSGMFMNFPDKASPGLFFGREEERSEWPVVSGEAMWSRGSKANTNHQCWLISGVNDLCLHP